MRKLQNTLYITTQGSYLHKERETLVVEQERQKVVQLPVHSIGHIFCFGNVLVSPFLLGFCGENNVNLAFFTENGRFLGRLQGRQSGNVLLRRAQDILEEFRTWWADRLVLSLINRGQIKPQDFVTEASGAVSLKADARKLLFQALQAKKQEKIVHPFLGEEVEIGLLPYIQAMLLARHLRGDLAEYPPFLMR